MASRLRDVAASAGVSVGTVSNVLNRPSTVAPETVERVRAAIAELGFVPNYAARALRAGTRTSIGMAVLDIENPAFSALSRGAERRAAEEGLSVLIGNSAEDAAREATYLDLFEQQRVCGVLIAPVQATVLGRLRQLRERGIPSVLLGPYGGGEFSAITVDNVAGGYAAASHFIQTGRRRLAFLGGPLSSSPLADRLAGAAQAVAENPGVTLEVLAAAAPTLVAGHAAAEPLADRRKEDLPDAIFAGNDLLAIGALHVLFTRGIATVPQDMAIVGFDDIDFAETAIVPLSSIRQPSESNGYQALDLLLREINDPGYVPQHLQVVPELVIRASSSG